MYNVYFIIISKYYHTVAPILHMFSDFAKSFNYNYCLAILSLFYFATIYFIYLFIITFYCTNYMK